MDLGLTASIYYTIVLWLPYFLIQKGFQDHSAYICSLFTIMTIPSILIFNVIEQKFSPFKTYGNLLLRSLATASCIALVFVPYNQENLVLLYIIIGSIGFWRGWFAGFTMSTELKERA